MQEERLVSDDFHDWPFVPTSADWTWDFDRATDFELQPLFVPGRGSPAARGDLADAGPDRSRASGA